MTVINFRLLEQPVEKDGMLVFWARSLSSDFLEEKYLEEFLPRVPNTKLIWRHMHPAKYQSTVMGYALEARVSEHEGKKFWDVKFGVKGKLQEQLWLQEDIKKRYAEERPLGISGNFYTYREKEGGELVDFHLEEFSGTPFPHCKECLTTDVEVTYMEDEDKKKKEEELEKEKEKETLSKLKVEELEKLLNQSQSRIRELEQTLEGIQENEETEEETEEEDNKVDVRLEQLETLVKDMKLENEFLRERKPIIDQIFELEKREYMLPKYRHWKKEELEQHLESLKSEEKKNEAKAPMHLVTVEDLNVTRESFENMSDEDFMSEFFKDTAPTLFKAQKRLEEGEIGGRRY